MRTLLESVLHFLGFRPSPQHCWYCGAKINPGIIRDGGRYCDSLCASALKE